MNQMDGELTSDITASATMRTYFSDLQKDIEHCYTIAKQARTKGLDPSTDIEIPQARDLAARVEKLVGPPDIAPKIRTATKKYKDRERVALEIAQEIANSKTYTFKKTEDALDQAIRTGLAILTEGVLVAPLEGIADVKLGKNTDGTPYVDLYFSGPIRSAGGTGQAMSVLIADVVRQQLNINRYQPTPGEIERYKEEIPLYKRVQHLQYSPTTTEIDKVVRNCPICINGEGTEDEEVTGYRDLPRVATNRLRGGACLVIAEGLCLEAPKILKHVKKQKIPGWNFLDTFAVKKETKQHTQETIPPILPSAKYIGEVIAGRPVFSHPSRKGGFRLRYGRARTAGLASTAINPATMYLLDSFITVGTQMKTERPGKGTIGTPCDTIEGPIVLLPNGDLTQINSINDIPKDIEQIIDLGEILIPFGEFNENNALLPDASYTYEWWIQDLQKHLKLLPKTYTHTDIQNADNKTQQHLAHDLNKHITLQHPTSTQAFQISETYHIPLHPAYNLFWHDITTEQLTHLTHYIQKHGKLDPTTEEPRLILPHDPTIKTILTELGALHKHRQKNVIIQHHSYTLIRCSGLDIKDNQLTPTKRINIINKQSNIPVIERVSQLAGIPIKPRAPSRIGARMGRPEKASPRKMRPPPHVLFPLSNYGGNQRLMRTAAEKTSIEVEAGTRKCPKCGKTTYKITCSCGTLTTQLNNRIQTYTINLSEELNNARKNLKERILPDTIKGVIGTISKHKTPEPLEKGILRAKHQVSVFKDGTIRFDMTDAPLTHFKPKEIGVTPERLKELGYTHDHQGNPLTSDTQLCELKVQDVIISQNCADYFIQVSRFIDDLLAKYYKLDRFYRVRKLQDLTGHLVVGLAPHTSGGALARIIGFTTTQTCFAHPYYHATKRRNCLTPNTQILISDTNGPTHISLQDLYNQTPTPETIVDDYGTTQKTITGIKTFSLNKKNGTTETKNITSIIKTKAPHHLLKITLQSGRTFTGSPYHRTITWSNGHIKTKKLLEITTADKLLTSHTFTDPEKEIKEIDLLQEFLKQPRKHEYVMIRGIEKLTRTCVQKLGGLKTTAKTLQLNKKTVSNYIYRNSIPLPILYTLLSKSKIDSAKIPRNCTLGVKRDHTSIPRIIKVDKPLMRLIGYYLAEGHARSTAKSCHQLGFACTEKDLHNDITHCIETTFKIKPFTNSYGVTICNRLIQEFFINILQIGTNAKNKQLPPQFTSLSKIKIRELLRAYFSGDGSVEKNRLHVTCSSINRKLLYDIGFQLQRFGIYYRIKTERGSSCGCGKKFYDHKNQLPIFTVHYLSIRSSYARQFYEKIGFYSTRKHLALRSALIKEQSPQIATYGEFILDNIKEITPITTKETHVYDVEVEDLHNFPINDGIQSNNCDGDEDGLMLLMDALLNFSHSYIPDKRGGRMDLPLILTTRIDPAEVDKEAHNIDTLARYPLEFYEKTLTHEHPKNLEKLMGLVAERIGTPDQYEHFGFTHDTTDISMGPKESLYKTLKSMMDKMNVQLSLAAKIRAVDEADVAYKVIERHFLPDILGNLRAFSKQSVRCPLCNTNYRRIPLCGICTKCGGKLTLTVHEMSVKKYLNISQEIAERYHIPEYACQRIKLVEKSIDSLFNSDRVKNTKLSDFF